MHPLNIFAAPGFFLGSRRPSLGVGRTWGLAPTCLLDAYVKWHLRVHEEIIQMGKF